VEQLRNVVLSVAFQRLWVALHFMFYNFVRPHKTLRKPYPTTPAMAAKVADHVWTVREIAALLD
jgi:hypothetical protein